MNSFYADSMLGKLARFLRFLGYDTLYRRDETVDEMIEVSKQHSRIILSRSKEVISSGLKNAVNSILISSIEIKGQLQTLKDSLELSFIIPPDEMRCSVCNGNLIVKNKDEIAGRIHERTAQFYDNFWECNSCSKIYWLGSHWKDIKRIIEELD